MLVLGHRGCVADVPENTLGAFEAAVGQGVDGFETDVRLTADGIAVLVHDRLAPGGAEVASLSRAALERALGHAVPTLEDALGAWPDLLWMIEVKVPEAAPEVERVLGRAGGTGRRLVTSFHHEIARTIADRLGVEGGVIVAHTPLRDGGVPFGLPPRAGRLDAVVWCYPRIDLEVVLRLKEAGYRSWAYDVATRADHVRALSLPLEGIVTDHPSRAR